MGVSQTAVAVKEARSAMMERYGFPQITSAYRLVHAPFSFISSHSLRACAVQCAYPCFSLDNYNFALLFMVSSLASPSLTLQSQSDNNDFCSACAGSGYLLCCDGCDRAFHFACLDPPLSQEASELQEPWFCFMCVAKRTQPQKQHRGLFSSLLANVDKRNPTVFSLPQTLRDYFEGMSTGKDGRFLDAVVSKTRYEALPALVTIYP